MKIYRIALFVILFCTNILGLDVPSPNLGEQSMTKTLRTAINERLTEQSQKIHIGVGDTGCDKFQKNADLPNNINVFLTWQWLDKMENLAKGTVVIMPKHAVDERFNAIKNKVELITIQGVLHSRTLENIQKEPDLEEEYQRPCIAMLPGDTQQDNKIWELFNQEMTADFIKDLPTDQSVLILNGPRTGKFKIIDGIVTEDKEAHKGSTDYITHFVMTEIEKNKKPWKIIDFQNGKSLWGAVLKYCVNHPKIVLILPGESTSMISEALSLGIKPVIAKHKAMTETSHVYVDSLVKNKQAILYPHFSKEEVFHYRQDPIPPQEQKIIKELKKLVKK